ncbi:hypothetical protein [Methylophilus luteus]|uniref:Uncharacterized protein n=1 Tax=Methylophilus luteus TaxID=640108 RepID=A0ABW3F888_9PROT
MALFSHTKGAATDTRSTQMGTGGTAKQRQKQVSDDSPMPETL